MASLFATTSLRAASRFTPLLSSRAIRPTASLFNQQRKAFTTTTTRKMAAPIQGISSGPANAELNVRTSPPSYTTCHLTPPRRTKSPTSPPTAPSFSPKRKPKNSLSKQSPKPSTATKSQSQPSSTAKPKPAKKTSPTSPSSSKSRKMS